MIFKGVMIARASGRLGDSVWAFNRGGPYVRTLGNPNPNPSTPTQDNMRAAYASCIAAWADLSNAERLAWETFSQDNPEAGRSGTIRPPGAFPAFVRANQLRYYANAQLSLSLDTPVTVPPATPWDHPNYVRLVLTAFSFSDSVTLDFDGSDGWYSEGTNGALLVWLSPPLRPTQNAHKGPMFLAGGLSEGNDNPAVLSTTTEMLRGWHVHARIRSVRADGRISRPLWINSNYPD